MRRHTLRMLAALVVALVPASGTGAAYPGDASYSVSKRKMDEALACKNSENSKGQPVLLVHGTGATEEINWGWNYWKALPNDGFDVCWVRLPKGALGDIQLSAEYVARAIEVMNKRYRSKVDVIGHSQGGLVQRWAIKWFPAGPKVDDFVALAAPSHGTTSSETAMVFGNCFASCWQMRRDAKFIAAINRNDETPGKISYTSIYTETDELVQPPRTARLSGGTNIKLQDLCPGRTVDHVAIAGDGVTYDLVHDALTHRGTTDLKRIPDDVCLQGAMDGATPGEITSLPDYEWSVWMDHEPRLKAYAR